MTMDNLSALLIFFTIVSSVATEFTCTRNGRLQNPNDPTNKTYYYCKQLKNGTYVQKRYKCPGRAHFNPSVGMCTLEATEPPSSEDNFECSQRGRFPDPTDPHCRRYYLCSTLHDETLVKVLYLCPNNTYFDPSLGVCSGDYRCTTETSTRPNKLTSAHANTEQSHSSTDHFNPHTESSSKASSTQVVAEEFVCTQKGRFKDPRDSTCSVYYLCSQLKTGGFRRTRYKCPAGSYFNPETHRCSVDYECSTLTTPYGEEPTVTQNSGSDRNTVPVSTNHETSEKNDGISTTSVNHEGISSTTNDEAITSTSTDESTVTGGEELVTSTSPVDERTISEGIVSTQDGLDDVFACTEKGRFADATDATCKNYFLCSELHNGTYVSTKYQCPKNSRFDPRNRICSTTYTCRDTTKKPCRAPKLRKSLPFACTQKGRYADPGDNACQLYYLCSRLHNGTFVATEYKCPEGSRFDPELGRCSSVYVCPRDAAAPPEAGDCEDAGDDDYTEETRASTIAHDDGNQEGQGGGAGAPIEGHTPGGGGDVFVCEEKGRYPDLNAQNCEGYYLCSQLRNGSFIAAKYKCPKGTYFDPKLQSCSDSYTCTTNAQSTTKSINDIYPSTSIRASTSTEDDETSKENDHTEETVSSYTDSDEEFTSPEEITSYTDSDDEFPTTTEEGSSSYINTEDAFRTTPEERTFNTESEDEFRTTPGEGTINTDGGHGFRTTPEEGTTSTDSEEVFRTTTKEEPSSNTDDMEQFRTTPEKVTSSNIDNEDEFRTTPETNTSSDIVTSNNDNEEEFRTTPLKVTSLNTDSEQEFRTTAEKGTSSNTDNEEDLRTTPETDTSSNTDSAKELRTTSEKYTTSNTDSEEELRTKPEKVTSSNTDNEDGFRTTPEIDTSSNTASENVFICKERGRFPDLSDESCASYYLCSRLRNGSLIATQFKCPKGTYFDANLHSCSDSYQCKTNAHSTTTTSIISSDTSLNTDSEDEFRTTPEKDTTSNTDSEEEFKTTPEKVTSSNTDNEEGVRTTPETATNTENAGNVFICKEKGRFPDLSDESCASYYLCSRLKNGSLIATPFKCPKGTYFDPNLHSCSDSYQCKTNAHSTTTTSIKSSTNNDLPGYYSKEPSVSPGWENNEHSNAGDILTTSQFVGESTHFMPDYTNFDSSASVSSYETSAEFFTPEILTSATSDEASYETSDEFFTPIDGKKTTTSGESDRTTNLDTKEPGNVSGEAEMKLSTPVSSSEDDSNESEDASWEETFTPKAATSSTVTTVAPEEHFKCTSKGRFADLSDRTCRSYYMCAQWHNGTFAAWKFRCPHGSLFNPVEKACFENYECPYSTESTEFYEYSSSEEFEDYTGEDGEGNGNYYTDVDDDLSSLYTTGEDEDYSILTSRGGYSTQGGGDKTTEVSGTSGGTFNTLPPSTTQSDNTKTTLTSHPNNNSSKTTDESLLTSSPTTNENSKSTDDSIVSSSTTSDEVNKTTSESITTINSNDSNKTTDESITTITSDDSTTNKAITTTKDDLNKTTNEPITNTKPDDFNKPTDASTLISAMPTDGFNKSTLSPTTKLDGFDKTTTEKPATTSEKSPEITTEDQLYTTPIPFSCSEKGRYANPNDATCVSYYLCSKLRNGTFIATKFNCPGGTYFHPGKQTCSSEYQCPTLSTTTDFFVSTERVSTPEESPVLTTRASTSTENNEASKQSKHTEELGGGSGITIPLDGEKTTTLAAALNNTDTDEETTAVTALVSSTDLPRTTNTDILHGHTVGGYNFCKARGYYKNYNDPSGISYFYCDIASDGRLFQYLLKCPDAYFYNDDNHLCTPVDGTLLT